VEAWRAADDAASGAVGDWLADRGPATEPGVARAVAAAAGDDDVLVVSSSMPVRDLEWYAAAREGLRVVANRGANGIDGVVSTAVGLALGTGRPTALLIGDVALLHDSNGLLGAARRAVDLTIVAVDNDGGGIFSFLPQAAALDPSRFEQLFGTPHGVDLAALAAVHGIVTGDDLEAALAAGPGVRMVLARTDRAANVAVHDALNRAIAAAL